MYNLKGVENLTNSSFKSKQSERYAVLGDKDLIG